jgi:hypothetical protein
MHPKPGPQGEPVGHRRRLPLLALGIVVAVVGLTGLAQAAGSHRQQDPGSGNGAIPVPAGTVGGAAADQPVATLGAVAVAVAVAAVPFDENGPAIPSGTRSGVIRAADPVALLGPRITRVEDPVILVRRVRPESGGGSARRPGIVVGIVAAVLEAMLLFGTVRRRKRRKLPVLAGATRGRPRPDQCSPSGAVAHLALM